MVLTPVIVPTRYKWAGQAPQSDRKHRFNKNSQINRLFIPFLKHFVPVRHIFLPRFLQPYCPVARPRGRTIFHDITDMVSPAMLCPWPNCYIGLRFGLRRRPRSRLIPRSCSWPTWQLRQDGPYRFVLITTESMAYVDPSRNEHDDPEIPCPSLWRFPNSSSINLVLYSKKALFS